MPQSKPLKDIRKQLFPTPPKYTMAEADKINNRLFNMSQDERRQTIAKVLGAMSARVTSPSKVYQLGARMFYALLIECMDEVQPDRKLKLWCKANGFPLDSTVQSLLHGEAFGGFVFTPAQKKFLEQYEQTKTEK